MKAGALGSVLAFASLVGGGGVARRLNRRHYEPRASQAGGDDVVPGAEAIVLDGSSRGVLILHGFGDTPQSIRALAMRLHARGWSVRAPLLHGHGRSLRAFTGARADDWLSDAREAFDELQRRSSHTAVIGQSMGGALATIIASERTVDSLVLLVPFMKLTSRAARVARFHRIVSLVVPYLRSHSESSILDPVARHKALGRGVMTPRLLHELSLVVRQAQRAAWRVSAPTLVVHSRRDPRVTIANAGVAFSALGSTEKTLDWVERSGHVISVDYDRELVAERVVDWVESHVRRG